MNTPEIKFWNREQGRLETEQVYGDQIVRWLYETSYGQKIAERFLTRKIISKAYGFYQDSRLSQKAIAPFIQNFKIKMSEYENEHFKTFNDFFIRRFKPNVRPFAKSSSMPAFAEARYLAFEKIIADQKYPVKGDHLSAQALLDSEKLAEPFIGGPLLIARLCPVDYHRFHYPDDGTTNKTYRIEGTLHSVNPLALKYKSDIFCTNERHISILETTNFGKLAYIEVGAMAVGKIIQTHPSDQPYKRGDEKGYFLFGASTVILMGEPGRWKPDGDIIEQSKQNRESFIKLGSQIGSN
ncbi:MAG: phosphatidylserine decarboxylase [Oligoflexia bacterium]|nr:phosphatidylserine decarboxylase [Oligoflexia bacterium]